MQIRARGNAFATGIGNWLVSSFSLVFLLSLSLVLVSPYLQNTGLNLLGASLPHRPRSTDLEVLLPLRSLEYRRHIPYRLLLLQRDETS